MPRDLEQEREQLLRQIEAALPPDLRERLQAACLTPQEPKGEPSKNEVGAGYADAK
jgi:hypothetical protein